jgi:hypothetical protein
MRTVTIELTTTQWAGVRAARQRRNADLEQTIPDPQHDAESGEPAPMIVNPALIATDEGYVQWVMGMAADSYCNQLPDDVAEILAQA